MRETNGSSGELEYLAARLFERMEHLDPTIGSEGRWESLGDAEKRLYRSVMVDLLAHKEFIERYWRSNY